MAETMRKRDPKACGDRCALILYSKDDMAGQSFPELRTTLTETVESIEHQAAAGHAASDEGYKVLALIMDEVGIRLLK